MAHPNLEPVAAPECMGPLRSAQDDNFVLVFKTLHRSVILRERSLRTKDLCICHYT
jgi:hypothetical protein